MTRSYRQIFSEIVIRFLNRRHTPASSQEANPVREPARQQCDEQPEISLVQAKGSGEPQPVVRVLDSSEDIAVGYSRPTHTTQSESPLAVTGEGDAAQKTCAYELPDPARDGFGTGASRAPQPSARHDAVTHRSLGDMRKARQDSATVGKCRELLADFIAGKSSLGREDQGREISGPDIRRKAQATSSPAPEAYKSILDALNLVVDAGCETVIDANYFGDRYCGLDTFRMRCIFCEQRICPECLKYEPCTSALSIWHKVQADS